MKKISTLGERCKIAFANIRLQETIQCRRCGIDFKRIDGIKSFCSLKCKKVPRQSVRKTWEERACVFCNNVYQPVQRLQKYCCKACCADFHKKQYQDKVKSGNLDDMKNGYYKIRFEVLKRDDFRCTYCGRGAKEDGVKLHVDHIIPESNGGEFKTTNLTTSCQECNLGKSDVFLSKRLLNKPN